MKSISRRNFLRGLGGFTLSIPFLKSLAPMKALAQMSEVDYRRYIAVCTRDGHFIPAYYPTDQLATRFANDVYHTRLTDIVGNISPALNELYDPFRSKMNIYRGLDIPGAMGHSAANMLAGCERVLYGDTAPNDLVGQGKSLDVVMQDSSRFYPNAPAYTALRGQEPSYNYGMSWDRDSAGKTKYIPYTKDPVRMFNFIFSKPDADPVVAAKFEQNRLLIGDMVLDSYKKAINHRRISSEDKVTLTNYIDELQDLSKRLKHLANNDACTLEGLRTVPNYWNYMTQAQQLDFLKNYVDIMMAAMKCGLTKISIISLRLWAHNHGNSHRGVLEADAQKIYADNMNLQAQLVTYFLQKLDAHQDPNGKSMLDNGIFHYGSEIGNGQSHNTLSLPAITFGSGGGAIKTGYYVDYRSRPNQAVDPENPFTTKSISRQNGRSYSQLLITIMKSMGLEPEDYHKWGDGGGFGSYNYSKYEGAKRDNYIKYEKDRNKTLPFISNIS